jgi:hypothetical protein
VRRSDDLLSHGLNGSFTIYGYALKGTSGNYFSGLNGWFGFAVWGEGIQDDAVGLDVSDVGCGFFARGSLVSWLERRGSDRTQR